MEVRSERASPRKRHLKNGDKKSLASEGDEAKETLPSRYPVTARRVLEVRFVGDENVIDHIFDKEKGLPLNKTAVNEFHAEEQLNEEFGSCAYDEREYLSALGTGAAEDNVCGSPGTAGAEVFTFQPARRTNKMSQLASEMAEMARTPSRNVRFSDPHSSEELGSPPKVRSRPTKQNKTPSKSKKPTFVSTTPHRLRKRLSAPNLRSDSDSELSASNSEEELEATESKPTNKPSSADISRTPGKRTRKAAEPSLVEEYFEAHSSSKVLTSDRTLQRLQTPKLDQETLWKLLDGAKPVFSAELASLNHGHKQLFSKWMLQLQFGFSIVLYGLGSKRALLESFRNSMLTNMVHLVINGFFPSITIKSILSAITGDVLDYEGSFRNPLDQASFILEALKKDPALHIFLIIHNIDGPMLRGEKTQQILAQLASAPNLHVIASIDHINAPLAWDQSKMSLFNWLWYETTTYKPYVEETSYENSLLVQQSGALALSSLTHVMRSLTPNARGIFQLLAEFQLQNKNNPSYTGLSFQDFYQRCREAFLVNSDLTLRTQLTEFRDHKLIRTKKGVDGVEYLIIPVDAATLTDFLEKETED
ncbi:origin recognition complex subunit 2 [Erpetoichthys calabaricus]|uniref:origin recognition complex subunit 2 n=1 Tax=Erpetoichthys calabaricus TaxID=27687 RepID=UPI0022344E0F|nr:origin recognition complex subunit 2 [Erpetoichthys calabaricus]